MSKVWRFLLLLVPLWFCVADASARPGGGHSYSGGSSSFGGGSSSFGGGSSGFGGFGSGSSSYDSDYSGDGCGGGVFGIVVMLMLVIFFGGGLIAALPSPSDQWVSSDYARPPPPDLTVLRRSDPEFSSVLFEDFMYHLYTEAHQARASVEQLDCLAPHFGINALLQLKNRPPRIQTVREVVIGSMTVVRLDLPENAYTEEHAARVNIGLRFESNMTIGEGDAAQRFYVKETWTVSRDASSLSVSPERMRANLCGNCGAPFTGNKERICASCDKDVSDSRFGWVVTNMLVTEQEPRPDSLAGHAPEVGTERLSRYQPSLPARLQELCAQDPKFSEHEFKKRTELIFSELYESWNKDDVVAIRPYVTDNQFNYLRYWLDAYRDQGLQNHAEDYTPSMISIVKVTHDLHFQAITVRVWASGKDFTTNRAGQIVGGSSVLSRGFSEYWTLIRSTETRGVASVEKKCPQCGAEQKISMAGHCEFCRTHITSGEFDWILSKIEQDESYAG